MIDTPVAKQIVEANHRFQLEYGYPPSAIDIATFLHQEAKSEQLRVERERIIEEMRRQEDEAAFARGRFTPGGALYTYACAHAKVGDWMVVPPNSVTSKPQLIQIVALGSGGKYGTKRPAYLVPRAIAMGTDQGTAGGGVYSTYDHS